MDFSADSGTLPSYTAGGGPDVEQELSVSNTPHETESRGTILLHLLEFKIHLLEAIEELHIRRGAETRFEDQISKLVLEKQELEWQKESLQHQTETLTNQHTESLSSVKKQFQAKIRAIEEEKGKHQLSAELKDKEINSLKEELKSLQLFKYSLEKKSSELEQKLALQSRSKDSHLKQLGEVEKRFAALSRQCATLKQAHEKLEQNVDEAMRVNTQLASANEKQEATINSLKQELEELNTQLIKAKVSSVGHCETSDHSAREQHVQQLQQRLLMETEMTRKLSNENAVKQTEKQEVMRSLQHAQQLLLSQTQLVSRVELELQTQREKHQALKREHEVMQEKSKAAEDKLAQLMEDYTTSKTMWDKEKTMFLERIKTEQQDVQAVTETYDQLHQKHTELSSQSMLQTQHIHGLETRLRHLVKDGLSDMTESRKRSRENDSGIPEEECVINSEDQSMDPDPNIENEDVTEKSCEVDLHMDVACALSQARGCRQSHSVSVLLPPSAVEGTRGEGLFNESKTSSEPPIPVSLQSLALAQTRDPDCLLVTEAVDKLVATGATGGQEILIHHQQPQCEETLIPSNLFNTPLATNNLFSLQTLSGATGNETNNLTPYTPISNTSENDLALVSNSINTNVIVSDGGLLIGRGSCMSTTVSVSSPGNRSVYETVDLLTEVNNDGDNQGRKKRGGKNGAKEGKNNPERGVQCNREDVYTKSVKDRGSNGAKGGWFITKKTDRAVRGGEGEESTEDAGETKMAETVAKDRAEGERKDGEEEGGRLVMHTPATEILAQTSADNGRSDGEKSNTPQAIDSMDNTELPLASSQPSDHSHILSQKVSKIDADTGHAKEGHGIGTAGHSLQTLTYDDVQTITHGPQPLTHEVLHLNHDGLQAFTRDVKSLNQLSTSIQQVSEKTAEEKPIHETAAHFPTVPSEPLNQTNVHSSQNQTALSASQTDGFVKMKGSETNDTQSPTSNTPDITRKHAEEQCDLHANEECVAVSRMVEPHLLRPSKEISEQDSGPVTSLPSDCGGSQSKVNLGEKDACESSQQPAGKSDVTVASPLHDCCVDTRLVNVGPLGSQASTLLMDSVLPENGHAEDPSTTNTISKEETGGPQDSIKNNKIEDVEDAKVTEQNLKMPDRSHENDIETSSSKCPDMPLANEMQFGDFDHSSLPSRKKHRSSFEWASAQTKKDSSRTKCDVSGLRGFGQGSPMSQLNTGGSGGFPGCSSSSTLPTFLKGQLNKEPLVIISASDVLNTSSISGPPASSKRDQQGEWKAIRETFRETATPDTESRAPLSIGSCTVSTSSSTVSRLSWQTASGPSRTANPGPSSRSDWFPPSSQESEDQQSFRAQISKIEQFLCTERLRLSKRRRTDN